MLINRVLIISIQHLFRFDLSCILSKFFACFISIQHLFRFDFCRTSKTASKWDFNTTFVSVRLFYLSFFFPLFFNFNTTFVSVRQSIFYRRLSFVKISIQHLFRFDKTPPNAEPIIWRFQYNICFGSTLDGKRFFRLMALFQYNICFGSTLSFNDFWIKSA